MPGIVPLGVPLPVQLPFSALRVICVSSQAVRLDSDKEQMMNSKLTKALLALALVGAAGSAAAHDRDRGWDRDDYRRGHREWRHDRDPWCHEHRAFHRHFTPPGHRKHSKWDYEWRRDGWSRSDYYRPYRRWDDDSLTIIFRSDLR
jgi:hypothetical protein